MPGSTHAQRDAEILNILVKRGADLTKPRHSLFYLYFPSKEQADAAKSEIKEHDIAREKKFKVEVRQDSEDTD